MPKKTTLQDKMAAARGLREQAALKSALATYLRTKYLPTDSRPEPFEIKCDGSPVSRYVIQEMADQLEAEAEELSDAHKAMISEEVTE